MRNGCLVTSGVCERVHRYDEHERIGECTHEPENGMWTMLRRPFLKIFITHLIVFFQDSNVAAVEELVEMNIVLMPLRSGLLPLPPVQYVSY